MIQNQFQRENIITLKEEPKVEWLLEISGQIPPGILNWEKISPKRFVWSTIVIWEEERKENITLILPERLTNPQYGNSLLDRELKELAKKAPEIEEIWKITKNLPSFTDLIIEERENE